MIFGKGYTATHLANRLRKEGWGISATGSQARPCVLALDDPAIPDLIDRATHILSSTPPVGDTDPVLDLYEHQLSRRNLWTGYLSSTGVYGDRQGAWVDETAEIGTGRRTARSVADQRWQDLHGRVCIFRLPGIYGPGRSALDRLRQGDAQRIDAGGQVFSRVHVTDIANAVRAAMQRRAVGVYNISDDLPAPGEQVLAYAAGLLGMDPPPLVPLEKAQLSPMARGFYSENRRVANGRMKRDLLQRLHYPDYRVGLAAILAEEKA
nr:SDR family NAD(P)-dependent oxidoreductase [Pacificimonas pallii]